jgi:hypothetical protein
MPFRERGRPGRNGRLARHHSASPSPFNPRNPSYFGMLSIAGDIRRMSCLGYSGRDALAGKMPALPEGG